MYWYIKNVKRIIFPSSSYNDTKPVPRTAGLYYSALACQEGDIQMYERQEVEPALEESSLCFLPIYEFCLLRVNFDFNFLSLEEKDEQDTTEEYASLNL